MFNASNSINVHVLQIPNDQNGKTAIVSASLVLPDGRVVSDICSVSPCSPFENEDTLEIAKSRVLNAVKQKAEPNIQHHQQPSTNAIQDDKSQFQGGGDKPATDKQIFLIQKLAEESGKNAEQLCVAKCGKSLSALTGRGADSVIKYLKQ